ncbi:MAG: helix-turn-helix domain-containing protein, partial [Planctomycetaceae bacterium]
RHTINGIRSMAGNTDLSKQEIAAMFANEADRELFPPILNVEQAANLAQVPTATIYDWSSRGLLQPCRRKVGRHLRFMRDRFIDLLFNKGLNSND